MRKWHSVWYWLSMSHKLSRTLKMLVYSKKSSLKPNFFSLCTDPFSVLCTQTLFLSVCEHCSVRYVRVCVHDHKYVKRNKEFCSRCSECVCVLYPRHSVQYINVAYFRVFFPTLVGTYGCYICWHYQPFWIVSLILTDKKVKSCFRFEKKWIKETNCIKFCVKN